ncbi:MAG: ACP S-malonyltransferase [Gemmatimonadaceae bacterium]|nr:ACP S-malonyltransferase [Gemmatimonadaceae bacterium]
MDVVLLFPGQGSQKPGMGKELVDAFPRAREVFAAADEALGESLSTLCFDGPAETLTLTANAQPALLTHGAAAWAVVASALAGKVRAAAGHSLGEFTAYHAAGSLTLPAAVRLVRERGRLMAETGVARPGAMAAILGDMTESVDEICRRASAAPDGGEVVPANYNAPGQVVISGEVAGVEAAMALCKAAGAKRAMRLNVSGAFHSPLMRPARDGLQQAIAAAGFVAPLVPVYANVTADVVGDAPSAERLCLEQLTAPVRWTELVERLAAAHPDALFVELGPGTVLAGLVRKIAPTVATAPCGTAADVEQLLARVA